MYVKISRLNFTQLWNSEYPQFVNQLTAIITRYKPESIHLSKVYNRLLAMMPQLDKIRAQELGNSKSNRLKDYDYERDALLRGIITQVKTYGKISLPELAAQVETFKRFLNTHGADIADVNYNAETKRVNDLLADFDASAELKAAAAALHLEPLLEQLRSVNAWFATLFLERTEENAAVEEVDARAIRLEADKHLVALFNAIEYCSTEYDSLNYRPLANEVNELVAYYKTQLKQRVARRNNGQETSDETPITKP